MIQTRKSVFETNSSMTHSLVICENGEYDKWLVNEVDELEEGCKKEDFYLFRASDDSFMPYKEAREYNAKQLLSDFENGYMDEEITREDVEAYATGSCEKLLEEFDIDLGEYYLTYDEFNDLYYYCEIDEFKYKTKSGDVLTGFCYYGRD